MDPVTSCVERITPATASKYLATNIGHQRNVTMTHVLHLRQQMERGQWMMTGEPIIFDGHGMLVDGQHRLRALVAAKVSLDFMVVRGVSTGSFMAMNRGKSRTSGNVFTIHGVKNANNIAACVGGVLNYRRAMEVQGRGGARGSLNSYIRPSTATMIEEYDAHAGMYDASIAIGALCKRMAPTSIASTVAAICLIDAKHDADKVWSFWRSVASGANLPDGSPILYLRNRYTENATSKQKMPSSLLMSLTIKCWNLHVSGRTCTLIRIRTASIAEDGKRIDGEGCPRVM